MLILNDLLSMPGRDGGGDERGAEEPNSRRVGLQVRLEAGWMAGRGLAVPRVEAGWMAG